MAVASHLISRMPTVASIRASVLIPLVQQIDKRSGKTDLLLASHGILRSQLEDPYAVLPMARYVALFEEAATITGEPALGARMGTGFKPADIGPIGMLFALSPTIRSAFERLSKYVNAVQGATSSGVFEENGDFVWSYRIVDPAMWPRRQDSEFTIAASCQLVRSCFRRGWRPIEIQLEHHAPRDAGVLERICGAPILFAQSGNRIVMNRAEADRVHRAEDKSLVEILERHIGDLVNEPAAGDIVAEKVQALIGIYLGRKPVTVATLAAELKMSPRSLQRRLSEEGVSLRDLVRQHRQTLAAHYLGDRHAAPMSEIASVLGYADNTVLWRALRSWEKKGNDPSSTG
ncbi:AraC family transcriptional regulator [Rhizobium leguminosarum]|uniref:AraC family transcriptional regulator n=1 Tax=Rhizobium leguminosarum TaxID=384 RepID=UPI001C94EB83|nr:AraC family transcriptional regulator [Rhizobium leguminosarum]MBY5365241.1 AraC family transcriptional regulator [Rhizobium leguminosarum]MBY5453186.1 AraC family transcriptional regulator [Rhizobium leguminosarum]